MDLPYFISVPLLACAGDDLKIYLLVEREGQVCINVNLHNRYCFAVRSYFAFAFVMISYNVCTRVV